MQILYLKLKYKLYLSNEILLWLKKYLYIIIYYEGYLKYVFKQQNLFNFKALLSKILQSHINFQIFNLIFYKGSNRPLLNKYFIYKNLNNNL